MSLISRLPEVRGEYRENANLARTTWFGVGGHAEILFRPKDIEDLAHFIKLVPKDIPINIIGVGSNLLIRDNGIGGVVIKLGRGFVDITHTNSLIVAGAGGLNFNVATFCKDNCLSGLEFLIGIPGSIGGALAMNAGAYGADVSSVLVSAEAIDPEGNIVNLRQEDFGFIYRGNTLPEGWIFTKACFKIARDSQNEKLTKVDNL